MIAADRERLSQLLDTLSKEIDHSDPKIYTPDHKEMARLIAKARAIVDQPMPATGITAANAIEFANNIPRNPLEYQAHHERYFGAPNPTLDAFLTEPIHEYSDPNAGPTGWAFLQRRINHHRHRAPNPWWLAVALTLAGILTIALTATPTTHPGPSHQNDPASPGDANLGPTRDTHGYTYPPRTP